MSDVEFDSDNQFKNITSPSISIVRAENKMAEWLMHRRIAKSEAQAQYILLGVAIGAIIIGIASWKWLSPPELPTISQEEIERTMNTNLQTTSNVVQR